MMIQQSPDWAPPIYNTIDPTPAPVFPAPVGMLASPAGNGGKRLNLSGYMNLVRGLGAADPNDPSPNVAKAEEILRAIGAHPTCTSQYVPFPGGAGYWNRLCSTSEGSTGMDADLIVMGWHKLIDGGYVDDFTIAELKRQAGVIGYNDFNNAVAAGNVQAQNEMTKIYTTAPGTVISGGQATTNNPGYVIGNDPVFNMGTTPITTSTPTSNSTPVSIIEPLNTKPNQSAVTVQPGVVDKPGTTVLNTSVLPDTGSFSGLLSNPMFLVAVGIGAYLIFKGGK